MSKDGEFSMRILVIGGVAAGTKAAAKIKREDRSVEVKILNKGTDISYAGCGLPYYVGGAIASREELIVNTPQKYAGLTGAEVVTGCEVTKVDPSAKTVSGLLNGQSFTESYDKLIIATGAAPVVPDMPGKDLPGVFPMRTPDDAVGLRNYVESHNCRRAVVAGAGFIGLEIAENLLSKGLDVTVVDFANQIMPNVFDPEMADFARRKLKEAGVRIITGQRIQSVSGTDKATGIVTDLTSIPADVVVLAIGVRPATGFLADTGLELFKGAVVVDREMRTNLPDIYAAGDCAMVRNAITGKNQWSAMGSTANLSARALAQTITGTPTPYGGCLGTGVVKLLPHLNAGRTGFTEVQARAEGFDPISVVCVSDDKAHYYPDASIFITKLIADRNTRKLLGIQVMGGGAVDKMVDVAAVGLYAGLTIDAFDTMDLAYAPPFSTAIHPFVQACNILENKLSGKLDSFTPMEYAAGEAKDYKVIDAQPAPAIPGAQWVDLAKVDGPLEDIGKDEKLLLVCARGKRGYFLQNRLKYYGYTNVKVLEGGVTFNQVKVPQLSGSSLPPTEVKRLKGLGCLWDKRTPDCFNVRVITRNGKLTAAEHTAVAEAAEKFGSGEVTMTTRLTMEIQGVPYENVEPLIQFLHSAGLDVGGTGSKVRPVVSCKGTTCQYGLCDTFALSEKLHELFYIGYHDVSLPHKFKIAVGGCPNNCVKPDLNDLGIVGQRLPEPDLTKCKGCKVCQIEKSCPIHAVTMKDGKAIIDPEACNHCGRCLEKCPFGAFTESTYGYKVYLGGRWGKKVAAGKPLSKIFTSEEEVIALVEKAILFFRDEGQTGERFADTIARLGFDYVEDKLLHGTIDKQTIMNKTVIGGASC